MTHSRRTITLWVLVTLVAAAGFAASTVNVTSANAAAILMDTTGMKGNTPKPTCPAPFVFSGKKASCVPCPQGSQYDKASSSCKAVPPVKTVCTTVVTTNGLNSVKTTTCPVGVKASASDIDTGNVTILGYIQANGLAKALVSKLTVQGRCFWIGKGTKHPTFTNTGARSGSGPYGKFKDTRRTFVCRTGKGPSGLQKVFDIGPNGQKEHFCANWIFLGISKPLITGEVIVVRNLANVHIHLHAEAHVTAANPNCPGTTAEGSGQADIVLTLSQYMRSHGNVTSRLSASAYGKATAKASASVTCTPTQTITTSTTTTVPTTTVVTTTTTAPPNHFVQISCKGFEEVSGGGSFLVQCDVSDDNGASISLDAHSNDGNSRVSGINCITNGGSASCPGNGTFEFRVSGINDGSSVLYSSVTAVASANGKTATYNSGQFPVDPSGGGF